jgi:hypothetical protein
MGDAYWALLIWGMIAAFVAINCYALAELLF